MRKLKTFLGSVTLLGVMATTALAQQGLTELRGRITDEQGGVLPGVTLLITNQDTGTFREAISSGEGTYFVAQLLPGTFTIFAQLPGFSSYERIDFELRVGNTLDLDIVLSIGALEETITVSGAAPLVDLTSAEVGGTVSAQELTELPLVNRSAFAAIALIPGLQFEPSASMGNDRIIANGQTGASSSLNTDGAYNGDGTSGGGGGSQVKVAIESISEFQVISNQFDAEFGRSSGAVINAVTKRGTNQITGALFNYMTNTSMTAKDFFTEQRGRDKPENSKYELGGVVGGPILQDRMHFFVSLERRLRNPAVTRLFATRPDLNRSTTSKQRAWNTMFRVDHQINASNSWAFRTLRELSPESGVSGNRTLNGGFRDSKDDEQIFIGTYTSVIGNNLVNTVRISRSDEFFNGGPQDCWRRLKGEELRNGQLRNCQPSYSHNSFRDNETPWAGGRKDNQWAYNNTTSLFIPDMLGDHDFKFGVTFHQAFIDDFREDFINGEFRMASDNAFNVDDFSTYPDRLQIRVGAPNGLTFKYAIDTWEAFFQDKWTVNDRWTVGLGIRWDAEMLKAQRIDNPLMAPGTDPRDWNNWSPRTSIAYDVTGDGRSVLRAGYGRFYDRTLFSGLDNVLQDPIIHDSFAVTFPRAFNRDPGPRNGLPITDPELLGALIIGSGADCGPATGTAANPVKGCPLVNHAYVNGLFPPGSTLFNESRVYLDNALRKQPWFHQVTFGYEREVMPTLSVSVDYVNMRGRELLNRINYIAPIRAGTSPSDGLTWFDVFGQIYNRTDTVFYEEGVFQNRVLSIQSIGQSQFDALNFQMEKRYANRWGARVSYALGHSRGNTFEQYGTNGPSLNGLQTQVGADLNLDENQQDSETDRRHILTLSGRTEFPGGITANVIWRYMTALPFTIYNSTIDTNMNGSFFDPLAAGTYTARAGRTNPVTVEHGGRQATARAGSEYMQLDLRLGYRLRPQVTQTVDIYFDVINLTNRTNFNNPTGNQNSGDFLNYTSLRGGGFQRQANFGIRYGF